MLANWKKRVFPLNRRQAVFAMLLCLVLAVNAVPALRASALYLITDGEATTAVELAEPVTADKLIVVGAADGSAELRFESGHKVTVTHGTDAVQYATTRTNETADALLKRMGISVGPMEMVKVDVSEPEIFIEIAASFTYYETLTEPAEHATVYTESYKVPEGETQVWQQGMDGTREVVYEVVYADGELVSRQAVAEQNNTSVTEYAYVGTLVKEAQAGDTIASVVKNSDGSGYLLMQSGDALHFTGSMEVKCTAYTTGYDGVGTITATGHHGRARLRGGGQKRHPAGDDHVHHLRVLHLRHERTRRIPACGARRSTCSWIPTMSASSSGGAIPSPIFWTESMKKPRAAALGFLFAFLRTAAHRASSRTAGPAPGTSRCGSSAAAADGVERAEIIAGDAARESGDRQRPEHLPVQDPHHGGGGAGGQVARLGAAARGDEVEREQRREAEDHKGAGARADQPVVAAEHQSDEGGAQQLLPRRIDGTLPGGNVPPEVLFDAQKDSHAGQRHEHQRLERLLGDDGPPVPCRQPSR